MYNLATIFAMHGFVFYYVTATILVKEYKVDSEWRKHIISAPDVLRGKPRIKGTRIPVSLILGYLASGSSFDEIIEEFPDISKDQIAGCLDYARDLSEFEVAV